MPVIKKGGSYTLFDFGANTTPRYVKDMVRKDGAKSTVYGNELKGRNVVGKHGHTVSDNGEVKYARTIWGTIKKK